MANQISLRIGHGKKIIKGQRGKPYSIVLLFPKKNQKKMAATHTHTQNPEEKNKQNRKKKQLKPRIYIFKK